METQTAIELHMKCESIPELKKFLTIQEQALGVHSPEVATTVSKLADLYLDRGMLDDAEALYRRALDIRERAIPFRREAEESRRSLNKVLALKARDLEKFRNMNKPATVQKNGATHSGDESSLNVVDTSWWNQPNKTNSATKSGRLSDTNSRQCGYDTSTALDEVPPSMVLTQCPIELSDAINEARLEADLVRQVSGCFDPTLADCLTKLADLYCRSKRYRDMEPLLLEALKIREARYGSAHQLVATSLKNLARLYYFEGKYHRAQPLFERALSIRRRIYGNKHAKVADILEQFAKLLEKTGITEDAEAMQKEALDIRRLRNSWTAF